MFKLIAIVLGGILKIPDTRVLISILFHLYKYQNSVIEINRVIFIVKCVAIYFLLVRDLA